MDDLTILSGKKILIVDDEPDVLDTLLELLDMCLVDTAPNFETAEKFLSKNMYDVAIFDIMGVQGYDLLEISNRKNIPALMFTAKQESPQGTVLYVHEKGKSVDAALGGTIENLMRAGRRVLAVDLRGTGETQQASQRKFVGTTGPDWKDVFTAYLLGRSYVGMRAEDVLVCARFLKQQGRPVELIAVGNVGVPALHAAALEPDLFASVKLVRTLTSWSNVIELGRSTNQQVNAVHGALTTYDLPDLAGTLADKLIVKEPVDALGEPAGTRRE